jgi:hypothetical protein
MPLTPFFSVPDSVRFWNVWCQQTEYFAKAYTVATLPDATQNRGLIVLVTNEAGGATLAFSSGLDWRRVQDRAVVS